MKFAEHQPAIKRIEMTGENTIYLRFTKSSMTPRRHGKLKIMNPRRPLCTKSSVVESVKRTAEKIRGSGGYHSAVRFTRLQILSLLSLAVNCWATIIRPLCGL